MSQIVQSLQCNTVGKRSGTFSESTGENGTGKSIGNVAFKQSEEIDAEDDYTEQKQYNTGYMVQHLWLRLVGYGCCNSCQNKSKGNTQNQCQSIGHSADCKMADTSRKRCEGHHKYTGSDCTF